MKRTQKAVNKVVLLKNDEWNILSVEYFRKGTEANEMKRLMLWFRTQTSFFDPLLNTSGKPPIRVGGTYSHDK